MLYEFGGSTEYSSANETKLYISSAEADLTQINKGKPYSGDTFTVSAVIENTGTLPLTTAQKIKIYCGMEYYIEPEKLQKMFNEDTGRILKVNIVSIDFYDVEEKTVTDINGDTVKTDYRNNDKNATYEYVTDYTVTAEPKVRNMQCEINWDDSGEYLRATFHKDGVVPASYYIGEDQEYKTLQELFKALGALKSNVDRQYDFVYECIWDFQANGYKLYSGDKDIYNAYVTINDSFFNTVKDTAKSSTYSVGSSYLSSTLYEGRNIICKWGDPIYWQDSLQNPQMRIEASDGQTISDGSEFKEYAPLGKDTVISISKKYDFWHSYEDEKLNFTSYKNIPVKTLIGKPFSLYVPVDGNNQLSEFGLRTVEYYGIMYYILDRKGEYKNVLLDGKIIDTVTVDKDKTFIEMYITPPERTDGKSYYGSPINLLAAAEKEAEFVPVYFRCGNINGHRYVDYVPLNLYHNGSLDLKIVDELGDRKNYSDDKVVSKKALTEPEEITYRMEFTPYYEESFTGEILSVDDVQNGSNFYLKLPQPPDGFTWSEENISVWYSENTDSNITDFSISNRECTADKNSRSRRCQEVMIFVLRQITYIDNINPLMQLQKSR